MLVIMDMKRLLTLELLRAHGAVIDELRSRNIVRSSNSAISDYTEELFCRTFQWPRENYSAAGFDASDATGVRFQIKARRITNSPGSRQLSAIRNLAADPFDHLGAVLFESDFLVHRAALIPIALVKERVRRSAHTNSDVYHLRDDIWPQPSVIDVTAQLRATAVEV